MLGSRGCGGDVGAWKLGCRDDGLLDCRGVWELGQECWHAGLQGFRNAGLHGGV